MKHTKSLRSITVSVRKEAQCLTASGIACSVAIMGCLTLVTGTADAKQDKIELSQQGQALEAQYISKLKELKTEIIATLPKPDQSKITALTKAAQAEKEPEKVAHKKSKTVAKLNSRYGDDHVEYLNMRLEYMPTMIADAKSELKKVKSMPDNNPAKAEAVTKAEKNLENLGKQFAALPGEIDKAKAKVEKLKQDMPTLIKEAAAAEATYRKAQEQTWKAMDALGASSLLGSDALDPKLAQYLVIKEATPRGLAKFSQQSPQHGQLIKQLLNNQALMIQMLVADGPNSGKFGEAMKIYTDIQKASSKAKEGIFQKLAMAVSLGHSDPIEQRNPDGAQGASEFVDPVKRYLSYEKWYLNGELDPGFKNLDVWNLVMAMNGREPDETYVWGRKMLGIMHPDCIPRDGDTTRYVDVVKNEIAYTSQNVKDDRPELQVMQNILANGGICGRQAFFGRFLLRAYGIPTTARKQPGHATLAHWHPDGWKVRLGGDWGPGARGKQSTMNRRRSRPYGMDLNFLASTQAREDETGFLRVKRAQWIGAVLDEKPMPGLIPKAKRKKSKRKKSGKKKTTQPIVEEKLSLWSYLALHEQQRVIANLASGTNNTAAAEPGPTKVPAATGKASVDSSGIITIPSASCSHPKESTTAAYRSGYRDLLTFLKNTSGDIYLQVSRFASEGDSFDYTFDAPSAGKYQLTAKVSTPQSDQVLFASVNGAEATKFALPYTIGLWNTTKPIEIQLKKGKNTLSFHGPARVAIHHFILTPAQ